MTGRLPHIKALFYSNVSNISNYIETLSGQVVIESTSWVPVTFLPGTYDIKITDKKEKGNTVFTTELSTGIREPILKPGKVIVKIEFDSDQVLIVGKPDYPVTLEQANTLLKKSLEFSYKGDHYPYFLKS